MMAELKTKKTVADVDAFINQVADEQRKADSLVVLDWFRKYTKEKGDMWGPTMVGFQTVKLKYSTGRELEWFKIGFSPRKQALTLYGLLGKENEKLLQKLGKYTNGKGCLYIKKLSQVDLKVLEQMIANSATN